jgi:hypothetical protein
LDIYLSQNKSYYFGKQSINLLECGWFPSIFNLSIINLWIEFKFRSSIEYYNMGWTSKLKSSNDFTLFYLISLLNSRNTAWNLGHTYLDNCNSSHPFFVSVDNKNVSRGNMPEKWLWVSKIKCIFDIQTWILQKITSRNCVRSFYSSTNRSMPPVIAPSR